MEAPLEANGNWELSKNLSYFRFTFREVAIQVPLFRNARPLFRDLGTGNLKEFKQMHYFLTFRNFPAPREANGNRESTKNI